MGIMATGASSEVASGAQQQFNYLNLLITQLQNQNPLDPMDSSQMTTQLAQISQVQQMETLNSSFKSVLQMTEMSYASSLIGKQVTFVPDGQTTTMTGTVSGVQQTSDGVNVLVGTKYVDIQKLQTVSPVPVQNGSV
jgi:flagellar basal-body rod modification protein FlgD